MTQKNIKKRLLNYLKKYQFVIISLVLILIISYLHYINSLRFSFTDAYNSYIRAYFMFKGRELYSEIFSHHNMLMVYLSYVIQLITSPKTLYQLVMVHRLAIAAFSILFTLLIIFRFRWIGVGFVILYEVTKYYLFGNLFLAESLVAYLSVYLLGLMFEKLSRRKLSAADIVLAGVFCWCVTFLREPFIPFIGVVFVYLYWGKEYLRLKTITTLILVAISFFLISTVSWDAYYFHLITLNFSGYIQNESANNGIAGFGIIKIFIYPFYLLFLGEVNDFRAVLVLLGILFTIGSGYLLYQKKYVLALIIMFVLGLANIRFRNPGDIFYSGFHMLPWYALFIFTCMFLSRNILKSKLLKWHKWVVLAVMVLIPLISVLPPYTVATNDTERDIEFNINYGRFYTNGEIIRILSKPDDTLFVDDWDTLVYWQSGLDSSYQYAMYFPVMAGMGDYASKRAEMFEKYPPDFFYTQCENKQEHLVRYSRRKEDYIELLKNNEPTCLFILKEKMKEITDSQWEQIKTFGYHPPVD